jgi:hypothetical protein
MIDEKKPEGIEGALEEDGTDAFEAMDAAYEAAAAKPPPEPKIMCYVSKEMVPQKDTVEVEYSPGKTFRVLPKYVKYDVEVPES